MGVIFMITHFAYCNDRDQWC